MVEALHAVGQRVGYVALAVEAGGAEFIFAEVDAREHNVPRSQVCKAPQQLFDIGLVIRPLAVGLAQHDGGLGYVRHDEVGFFAEPRHAGGKIRGEEAVERAVVGHGGVDDREAFVVFEGVEDLAHDLKLFKGAQKAAVERVELKPELFPVTIERPQVASEVAVGEIGEAAGVRRKYGRWHDARRDAGGRKDGKRDGERAFAEARDIVDCSHAFLFCHDFTSVLCRRQI